MPVKSPTLEFKEVEALFSSDSLSDKSRGVTMLSRISTDLTAALWNDSEMVVGWIPCYIQKK